ncbi:methyl-accepting chemotaxis protein [Ectothiorhodospira magna]|uniref:Methyl-accepting chemotaxis protein n=2 Tax=Ectothiorhodospira magna TaxID=867345 RepID=A0A1H9CPZ4_9GAMM|nr:methyl-accepting chemotaxis protein [Ectothiorhodospira magna]
MFKNLSLQQRLVLNISIIGLFLLAISLIYVTHLRGQMADQAVAERSEAFNLIFQERLQAKKDLALGLAMTLSSSPIYINALESDDRDLAHRRANHLRQRLFDELQAGTVNTHIHTADGRTWLRSWSRDFYDDDITFRPSVNRMLREQSPFTDATEVGRSGLTIRALAPIRVDGEYRGAFEIAMGFDGIRQGFEAEGRRYIFLLPADITDIAPGVARNTVIGDFLVANDSWFGSTALDFARQLDLDALMHHGFLLNEDWFASVYKVHDDQGRLIGVHIFGEDPETVLSSVEQMVHFSWLMIGLLVVLIIVMGLSVAWMVRQNIVRLIVANVERLGRHQNDLTLQLDTGKYQDELQQLFSAFNGYTATLRQVLQEVAQTTTDLSSATGQLVSQSQTSQKMAFEQTQEVNQVASASTQMAASATEVASQAASTQEAANQAQASTREGVGVVTSTVQAIDRLAREMSALKTTLGRLEEGSSNIGEVITTIENIAEQTNLLALNAAIEAARAGDHGRGFAVVADEVRQLASRTQRSTGEIQQMIQAVQQAANDVSTAIEAGAEQASRCAERAQEAGNSLEQIDSSVNQVSEWGVQIASAAHQQSQVAEEISANLARINNLVAEALDAMQNTQQVSKGLAERAESLNTLIGRFKI